MFSLFRNELLIRPVYNALLLFLEIFQGNLWLAIISLTILFKLALYKSSAAWTAIQSQMWSLQPKMQELQEKHKDNPEQLSKEMMTLLKKDGAGPLKWCLSMLIQMPIFLWLYAVISNIANPEHLQNWMKFSESMLDMTYSFLYPYVYSMIDPSTLDINFLGTNLLANKHIGLSIIAGIGMRINMKIMTRTRPAPTALPGANMPDMTQMMNFMNIFLVLTISAFVYSAATGIGLYIATSTLFWILQIYYQHRILVTAKIRSILKV